MPPKAKPDTAAYQKLKKDIKEGTIGTLYVFHGEEAYLRDFYLGQLKKKLLPAGMEEFNLHTLSGKEFDVKTLAQLVDCLPMMSERTLIVVNDYDIYKGDKDALAAVLRELPDYVCLVFVYDLIEYKADARTKLAALLKAKGSVVSFHRQEQGDLVDWISRRFRALDRDIGTEDAKYLMFLCGDLMNNLISEIGKIGAYAKGHRVTRSDIDAVATPQLDAVVFQMTDAIAAGNFDRAAGVLSDLYHMQEAPIKILAVLGKQLRQLSEGMKVKFQLALALSHGAKLLILDEPSSGLDPVSRAELKDIFRQLAAKGAAILFSTHITTDLLDCADDITYIQKGHIVASKPMADFLADHPDCDSLEDIMVRLEKEDITL